ncbi:MAG: protein kinase [Acidobacteria bacterium]|nr:protein kinase [Acidobacteriota bacterium]
MSFDRRQQAKDILHNAATLADDKRTAFINERCAGDESLRTEVEALLRLRDRTHAIAQTAISEMPTLVVENFTPFLDANFGKRIGAYEIVRQLGQGGMGAVYEALRADEQFSKRVAIKIIKRGMDSDFVIQRFRQERQILATLDHPNIARLLDGGTTEDGLPYIVMEYIEGKSINVYCDDKKLPTVERLKLFQQVCAAIHYAHQNLVVHRDIKPGNIIVTEDGVPKVLDFGIAKLLASEFSAEQIDMTAPAVRLMTPAYASPEQVKGEAITTASDTYALGVLLYQLLTGLRPYQITSIVPQEIARVICEQEPDKPSTAVKRLEMTQVNADDTFAPPTSEALSELRQAQPETLRRQLAGDLDNIILKALQKEPQRRYASVEQFSEDLRRHLEGLPVIARQDTFVYRSSKFIRRHKTSVAAALLIFLTLIGGIIGTTWQSLVARSERARAEKRFNDVCKLANSFLFEFHDSIQNLAGATPARALVVKRALEYLDSLSEEAGNDLSLQRELATAYEKVGDVQGDPYSGSLGDSASALASHRKALAIREKLVAADAANPALRKELASSYVRIGSMNWLQGKWDEAFDNFQRGANLYEALVTADPTNADLRADLSQNYSYLGDALAEKGALEEAVASQCKALAIRQEWAAASTDQKTQMGLASSYVKMADVLLRIGKMNECFDYYDKALKIFEALMKLAPDDDDLRGRLEGTYQRLGEALRRNDERAQALEYFHKCREMDEARVRKDPTNAVARRNLMGEYVSIGMTLMDSEKPKEAVSYYQKALEMAEALAAADPHNKQATNDLLTTHLNIGGAFNALHNRAEAEAHLSAAITIAEQLAMQESGSADSKDALAIVYLSYGFLKLNAGEAESALGVFRKALTVREALVAETPTNVDYRFRLADVCSIIGEAYEALAKQSKTSASQQVEHWQVARSWFQRSLELFIKMRDEKVLAKGRLEYIDGITEGLARCDAALAKLKSQ